MRAAVYSSVSEQGVAFSTKTKPSLQSVQPHLVRRLFLFVLAHTIRLTCYAIHLAFTMLSFFFPKLRPRLIAWDWSGSPTRRWLVCRVHCAGVNPVDAKHLYGDKLPHFLLPLVKAVVESRTCGIDFSGVVVECGPQSTFKVGDAVFGTVPPFSGSMTEYVCAPEDSIALKPHNLSFAEAAALPLVGLTALQSLSDHKVQPGNRILILGASGGTGHIAVQIAKAMSAHVTAVCGSNNLDFVRSLGADEAISYTDGDVLTALQACVAKSRPFDLVFDTVSSHDPRDRVFAYESRIRSTHRPLLNGPYIFIGGLVNDWLVAHLKRFCRVNLFSAGRELFWVRFPFSADFLQRLAKWSAERKLKVQIAKILPFNQENVRKAFQLQMDRRTVGKIVLQIIDEKQ